MFRLLTVAVASLFEVGLYLVIRLCFSYSGHLLFLVYFGTILIQGLDLTVATLDGEAGLNKNYSPSSK